MDAGGFSPVGAYEERIVATIDGLALYVRDYAPLKPETGLPVICLHGLTRNSRDFETIAPRIAACGRRVIAPDMRGRGQSANDPDPSRYTPSVYAQDVVRIMDALGVSRAVFVGTSMGGLITMMLATLDPERIEGAVLNDIGHKIAAEGLARIAGYVGGGRPVASWREAAEMMRSINAPAYPSRLDDPEFWDVFARRTFRQRDDGLLETDYDPRIALAFAQAPPAPAPDMTPLFQALAAKPMLVVRGAISDILSSDAVAEMRALKPDLAVVEAEHVGHAPLLDEPAVWDALLSFLARVD